MLVARTHVPLLQGSSKVNAQAREPPPIPGKPTDMIATKLQKVIQAWLSRIDGFQQRHAPLAFVYAVQKKYENDRGGSLAALVSYNGFLALFPLLLVFATISSYVLAGHPALRDRLIHSAISHFPLIGPELKSHSPLQGSVWALIIGVAGLILGAQALSRSLIHIMHQIWNIPVNVRPGNVAQLARGILLDVALGLGVVGTTAVSSLGSILHLGAGGAVLVAVPSAIVNVGLFTLTFRIVSPRSVPTRDLLVGAAIAGVGWQILQTAGLSLIVADAAHASELYGTIGIVLGFLGFLFLAARISIFAAEVDAVRASHLWPRAVIKPLSDADRRELVDLAVRETRDADETVEVTFQAQTGALTSGNGA
jgi:YihY family inner membrane protein